MSNPVSLLAYTRLLRGYVSAASDLRERWVMAELSDVAVRGGHCYLELVEKNDAGQTVAKMRATIWQSVYYRIRAKFVAATGREFSSGIKLMLRGSANFHEIFGMSFNVSDVDPAYTLGDMERIRREILAALAREGVAEANRNLAIAPDPQRIAVISAPGAAGFGDFMNQLHGNPTGIVFYTRLFESVMQGERAADSVRAALSYIEMTVDLWDCVVIIRGGGASTDLNCFDNLQLARQVALFPIPVIVGIGHERDRTVLDEIAHTRVKTPTAAAEFLVGKCSEALRNAEAITMAIITAVGETITGSRRQLDSLATLVRESGHTRIAAAASRLDSAKAVIPAIARRRIDVASTTLYSLAKMIPAAATSKISLANSYISHLQTSFKAAIPAKIANAGIRLDAIKGMVETLSPENTLRRGYSITLGPDGKAVRRVADMKQNQQIITVFTDGKAFSTISKTEEK